jgi:threonine dehydrogenase-like Zn-dependent dehydrogenase
MSTGAHEAKQVVFESGGRMSVRRGPAGVPGDDQVLVRMMACGICLYDTKCFKDPAVDPVYSARPGHEGVGVVVETGKNVRDMSPGDKVTGVTFGGALSEMYLADRSTVAKIPGSVSRYEHWIAEPAACVVNSLRHLRIEPGDDVVVYGTGYMGLLILQGLPKEYIRTLVAIDVLDDRLALAKKYGAEHAVNARRENPVEAVLDLAGGKVDLVIEAVGLPGIIPNATDMLGNGARLCLFGHHAVDETVPTCAWHMRGIEVLNTTPFNSKNFPKDLVDAVGLMEKGRFGQEDLVSRTYPYEQLERALHELSPKPPEVIKAVLLNY